MNRGNIVKKIIIVAIWGVLLALLFIAAQNLPTIRHITEDSETTYEHATDEYRIDLTGRWQVSVDGPGELILLQEEANASIVCNLEVGGYDYLSSKEIADKIQESLGNSFDAVEFSQRIGETEAILYDTLYFTGTCTLGDKSLSSEHYVIHPSEGIRLYVNYFYPQNADDAIVEQGRNSIFSIYFFDLEKIYQKYLT